MTGQVGGRCRDVAIKALPPLFAADPYRLARFEREAQTLAALNHPNIAQIHGVEESGAVRALVMELVDGLTLDELLDPARVSAAGASDSTPASGGGSAPVTIEDAIGIARQIADALEAAHDRGIVHRDLNPPT